MLIEFPGEITLETKNAVEAAQICHFMLHPISSFLCSWQQQP